MNNNQFKKFIRQQLELECNKTEKKCIYADSSNRERMYFIYNSDYSIYATLRSYLSNDSVHFQLSYSSAKIVSTVSALVDVTYSFLELKSVVEFLAKATTGLVSDLQKDKEDAFVSR